MSGDDNDDDDDNDNDDAVSTDDNITDLDENAGGLQRKPMRADSKLKNESKFRVFLDLILKLLAQVL